MPRAPKDSIAICESTALPHVSRRPVRANDTNAATGADYLGAITVKTNAVGTATFTYLGPLPPAGAEDITATATSAAGDTSEFSAPIGIGVV